MKTNQLSIRRFNVALFSLLIFCLFSSASLADVKPARVFGDNMVLQRNKDVNIWGWAAKGEKITVIFNGQIANAKTDEKGKWLVRLKPMKEGGPFEMTIKGKNTVVFKNILIGEVWICSGQSNMEWKVNSVKNAEQEMAKANYPQIRSFTVDKRVAGAPKNDLENGSWEICSPQTVGGFTAVGYFFALNLYQKLNIPIGLIHTSWGGTVAETWISNETMQTLPDFSYQLQEMKKLDIEKQMNEGEKLMKEWNLKLETEDLGKKESWQKNQTDVSKWKTMKLPGLWENNGLQNIDGTVWFRTEFELSAQEVQAGVELFVGQIDDSDESFVNDQKIGETWNQYSKVRQYKVDAKYLKTGKNILVVRVIDTGGGGGIYGEEKDLCVKTNQKQIPLSGNWLYRRGTESLPASSPNVGPNTFPSLLFNGMVAPLVPYTIQGAIWYQGEANAGRAYQYRTVFPKLIADWRTKWNQGEFPFLFVQLANYMPAKTEPSESEWAELREAQSMTLSLKNTGLATAVDIGEALDIHPRNKQDVGLRLSLAARKIAYSEDLVFSGPTYKSCKVEGDKITITFDNVGSGLLVKDKYGYVKGFSIAGEDKKFYWAKASTNGKTITVYSDKVKNPVAVRYGWADNPDDINLYNNEGLPALPFRTDTWDGLTKNNK